MVHINILAPFIKKGAKKVQKRCKKVQKGAKDISVHVYHFLLI